MKARSRYPRKFYKVCTCKIILSSTANLHISRIINFLDGWIEIFEEFILIPLIQLHTNVLVYALISTSRQFSFPMLFTFLFDIPNIQIVVSLCIHLFECVVQQHDRWDAGKSY